MLALRAAQRDDENRPFGFNFVNDLAALQDSQCPGRCRSCPDGAVAVETDPIGIDVVRQVRPHATIAQ